VISMRLAEVSQAFEDMKGCHENNYCKRRYRLTYLVNDTRQVRCPSVCLNVDQVSAGTSITAMGVN
jgi:hypothetical protein